MKYITPIKFPKFNLELPKQQIKKVVYTDPSSILCFLEIYEETPETTLLTFNAPSNFPLTYLDPTTAKLVEFWNMKDGACIFDPGSYWHTVRNTSDNYIHVLSFRSKEIKSLIILKNLIEPLV